MHNKTIIWFVFCDIRNNHGFLKCYHSQPSVLANIFYLDVDCSKYHKTSSINCLLSCAFVAVQMFTQSGCYATKRNDRLWGREWVLHTAKSSQSEAEGLCREVCILVRYKLSWVALGTRMKKSPFVYEEVRSRCTRGNMGRRCLLTLSSSHSPLCVGCCANSLKSRQATIVKDSSTCRLMFDNKIRSSLKFELILII